jgi:DNA-binding beta-propeller fold protein YncE
MRILLALLAAATAATPAVVARIPVAKYAAPCAAAAGGRYVWVSEYGAPYLLKIDPRTNRVVARTGIGTGSCGLGYGAGSLRIDPRTNKVVGKTGIGSGSCGLGYGAGSLWVEDTSSSTVSRVSAATGKRLKAIRVGITPYDTTFAYGAVWTTAYGRGELERIDPKRNRVVAHWQLPQATGVVGAFGSVWAAGATGVIRVDPATGKLLATVPIDTGAGWTAASTDAVWVTTPAGLARIDPQTNVVETTVALAGPLGDPDVVGGMVWVPQIRKNAIAVVDPATNTVVRTVKSGAGPFVVTAIAGEAWVPSWKGKDIWRFRP